MLTRLLIYGFLISALLGALAWRVHAFIVHEQDIGYQRAVAEYTAKVLEETNKARAKEAQLTKQLEVARNDADVREQTIKGMSIKLNDTNNRLRNTISAYTSGMPRDNPDAYSKAATTLGAVLTECAEGYRGLAETADRHASDVRTLTEAWPR